MRDENTTRMKKRIEYEYEHEYVYESGHFWTGLRI